MHNAVATDVPMIVPSAGRTMPVKYSKATDLWQLATAKHLSTVVATYERLDTTVTTSGHSSCFYTKAALLCMATAAPATRHTKAAA